MSQTAESARDWINSASPTIEQLENAAAAIERKLKDHPSLDQETRQNLAGALEEVSVELQTQQYAAEEENDNSNLTTDVADNNVSIDSSALGSTSVASNNLDTSDLGESADPSIQVLQGDAKKAAFAALKAKLQQ